MHLSVSRMEPNPPDAAGIVSWVHLGDLHMTLAGEQNHVDLLAMVQKMNASFSEAISFVFLPGDVADHGSAPEYAVVRSALDQLQAPWCATVGDHDVHEHSFENFTHYMSPLTHYAFAVGSTHFLALNAFEVPDPGSFSVLSDQLIWLETQLSQLPAEASIVIFLHCYPTDLKVGGGKLREILQDPRIRLVDMGHTHYNEVANDGHTLYTATRSSGQIEEGPVGFSVVNLDGDHVSWRFMPLVDPLLVMITSPSDERLLLASHTPPRDDQPLRVRAKAWGEGAFQQLTATLQGRSILLSPIAETQVWEGAFEAPAAEGVYDLTVQALHCSGAEVTDRIRVRVGRATNKTERAERDQDNALGAWPEHGLLGTQLGPNKNGRKW